MSRAGVGAFALLVAGLSGCATPARVIYQDSTKVVIAVPDNSNAWPYYYQDAAKEYRWRLKAANGAILATSGQGYKAKADCKHAIDVIKEGAAQAAVEEVTAK